MGCHDYPHEEGRVEWCGHDTVCMGCGHCPDHCIACAAQPIEDETHRETPLRRYAVSDEPSGNDSPRSVKAEANFCDTGSCQHLGGCPPRSTKGGEPK